MLHAVKKEELKVTVTEKGQLESADNRDIVCKVRAGQKGYATTITWVIDDGTRVKPGQLIMILEDSALKDQEETQQIAVAEKLALKVRAEKDYEITVKKNESAVELARAALALAAIELDKLTGLAPDPALAARAALLGMPTALAEGGSYQQELDDLSGQISLARSEVEQNKEKARHSDRMVRMTYMSAAQAAADQSRLASSEEKLRGLEAKRKMLLSHDRKQRVTDLTSKRDNAARALDQARLEAEATEAQAKITRQTSGDIYQQQVDKLEDIQKQRRECRIHAPDDIEDGSMVVYFKPEGSGRFGGSSSSQGLIEPGAQVKEGQKMLRIPNLSRMQVNTKVHEAMVSRLRGEVRVPTKIVEFAQVGMLLNPDPYGRLLATRPDAVEKVREELRRFEYRKVADGQRALVRVESLSDRQFAGHVRSVAPVASQADSWANDVKLYPTFVRVDGELAADGTTVTPLEGERLKPDMTAEVTISVDATAGPVLTVPLQAVIGGAEMGGKREVFVRTPDNRFERKPVTLGLYNERMVEVRDGLAEGDEVVTNPKVLLGDKDKTKTREAGGEAKGESKGEPKGGDGADKGPGAGPGGEPTKKGKRPPGGMKGAGPGAGGPPPG
jgi:multidrug efflux pump subunit AcrA (membrane-fusion protein)